MTDDGGVFDWSEYGRLVREEVDLALGGSACAILERRLAEAEAERDKARREVRALRDQHARILSWPTQDVARAKAVIMQAGAKLAREGHELGKAVAEAVDALERQSSQLEAELDKLRPVVEAARLMFMAIDQGDEDAQRIAYLELRDALAALDAGEGE